MCSRLSSHCPCTRRYLEAGTGTFGCGEVAGGPKYIFGLMMYTLAPQTPTPGSIRSVPAGAMIPGRQTGINTVTASLLLPITCCR